MRARISSLILSLAASAPVLGQGGGGEIYSLVGKTQYCDHLGYSLAALGDIDGDGAADFAVGAVQAYVDPEAKGYVWVVSGSNGHVIRELQGEAIGNRFGRSIAAFEDVDRDGIVDLAVSGGDDLFVFSSLTGEALKRFPVVRPNDDAGSLSFIAAGDLDGDGSIDILLGQPGYYARQKGVNGRAAVYSGKEGRSLWDRIGESEDGNLGSSFAVVADADGDKLLDVAVGESHGYYPEDDFDENQPTGTVHILRGIDGREIRRLGEDLQIQYFGSAMANVGDLDGDKFPELIVGAPGYYEPGRMNLGWVGVYSTRTWTLIHRFVGIDIPHGLFFGDALGVAVSSAGDADGDRVPDFLLGARHFGSVGIGPASWGRVELRSGKTFGLLSVFEGSQAGPEPFVTTLGPLGDIDGDGRDEFLIGSIFSKICSGQVFVVGHDPDLPAFRRGDANRDGVLDISDAIVLIGMLYFAEPRGPCLAALDLDGNHRVDLVDPVWIILYLFEGGYSPAPPFPDCGRYGGLRELKLGCDGSTCEP
jgi:hypothetical protein